MTRVVDTYATQEQKSISHSCELLGRSRQVYYRRIKSVAKKQARAMEVIELVKQVRYQLPRLGTRKLYHILQKELQAMKIGRDKLFDILRANHLLIEPKRSYYITTNSHHRFRKHKNLVEKVVPTRPDEQWVSDITYIGKRENPMYLALITDAYSKKIVGYDVSNSLDVSGCLRALKQAVKSRKDKKLPLIHHSDRGLQYCSDTYQELLAKNKIQCSMTESYDPYANAVAERINGILKQEFKIDCYGKNVEDKKVLVADAIKKYNTLRPHYSCFYRTPEQMHRQNEIQIRTYKKIGKEKSTSLFQLN
ncbi:IS3 family transposase [Weeksellaceae bacterium TAE3-ERU29]|nr:IS3 family transposase [Weeksellaceae bacterium TAE3-ERU29]